MALWVLERQIWEAIDITCGMKRLKRSSFSDDDVLSFPRSVSELPTKGPVRAAGEKPTYAFKRVPPHGGTICQVSADEIEIAEIEGFFLEGQTEERIWVKQSAGGRVVLFTISADGMGLTGESQVVPKPSSPLEREVITAPARRAAYEFLSKLRALRER
jgi:hypothetical protein